ncbi:hypothetical protein [Pseudomonas sp. 37 R 15]|uniref:hypothetical protein n=1 Tax=Pseudomonas sp. 37 R 15 TaxID=1844104 RepID=UPI0008125658|nr:hypothetical protein [Pseudomonas sp. 37 R 15]CRM40271.1 hypothetical protein [Pseudomonas sp. 37 R 15]
MTDYTELKRLAEAAQYENCEFQHELVAATKAFFVGCIPEQILALIAENDRLNTECKQLILLEHNGGTVEAATNLLAERDHFRAQLAGLKTGYEAYERVNAELKADAGRLTALVGSLVIASGAPLQADLTEFLEALRKDAARYEWLRQARSGYIEVVEWIGPHATGMTGEDLDALLDAAMGKGERS